MEIIPISTDMLRIVENTSKKGNFYKCLEVCVNGRWNFVCFVK